MSEQTVTAFRAVARRTELDPAILGPVLSALTAALRGDHKPDGFEYILRHYDEAGTLVEETTPRAHPTRLGLIFGRSRWPDRRFDQLRRPWGTGEEFVPYA
jgi:hypothetical protein